MSSNSHDIQACINDHQTILITIHRDPDIDAIGSACALALALINLKKTPIIWCADNIPQSDQWIPHASSIINAIPDNLNYSLIITLDCSNIDRIKDHHLLDTHRPIINIDHHQDNTRFGGINLVENISSVGELMTKLMNQWHWEITPDIATCLYSAISFDTGHFRHNNTTENTFSVASELLKKGVNNAQIATHIFGTKSLNYYQTIEKGLHHTTFDPELNYVLTQIPNGQDDTYSIIDFIRQWEHAEVAVILRELEPKLTKVSLRSKTFFDVSSFSHQFGGGGHKHAAGIRFNMSLSESTQQLESALKHALSHRTYQQR